MAVGLSERMTGKVWALYSAASEWSDCILGQLILANNSYVATGIRATLNDNGETLNDYCVYDLQGRKMNNLRQKGLYIRNGKKYIIR